jgi:hypothetical protein
MTLALSEAKAAWDVADAMLETVEVERDLGAVDPERLLALAVSVAKGCRIGKVRQSDAVILGAMAMRIAAGDALCEGKKQEKVEAA